ncbi:MAG: rhodanese-like domain-containing protein [Pseudomonadota bacterium]
MNTTNSQNWPRVIEPEEVMQALNQSNSHMRLLDLSQPQTFSRAHIPTAIHIPPVMTTSGRPDCPGLAPSVDAVQSLMNRLNLTSPEDFVVLYDDEGGGWAGRMGWLLDTVGFHRYALLRVGIQGWLAAGLPTETQLTAVTTNFFTVQPNSKFSIYANELQNTLNDVVIWDARSPEEFNGQRIFAQRGGHIPGAINYEWTQLMDFDQYRALRPLEEIRADLEKIGITADKKIITHCQTHHRSGLTYVVGRILGFDIAAYSGSWSEWGNDVTRPIETTESTFSS